MNGSTLDELRREAWNAGADGFFLSAWDCSRCRISEQERRVRNPSNEFKRRIEVEYDCLRRWIQNEIAWLNRHK